MQHIKTAIVLDASVKGEAMTNGLILLALGALVVVWSVMLFMTFATLDYYRKRKLLRCPETGGAAFVEIEREPPSPATSETPGTPRLRVKDCHLWRHRMNCSKGCLDHAPEIIADHTVGLSSV